MADHVVPGRVSLHGLLAVEGWGLVGGAVTPVATLSVDSSLPVFRLLLWEGH